MSAAPNTTTSTDTVKPPATQEMLSPDGQLSTAWRDFFRKLSDLFNKAAVSPIGSYMQSAVPPGDNWLECDGTAVENTKYPALYDVLKGITAPGGLSGTFKLPDFTPVYDIAHPAPAGPAVLRWFIRAA